MVFVSYGDTNAEDLFPTLGLSINARNGDSLIRRRAFPGFHTTQAQMNAKCVPYVELVTNDNHVTGIRWRFVDPSRPSEALKRGTDSNITAVFAFELFSKSGLRQRKSDFKISPEVGASLEGLIEFQYPRHISEVSQAAIEFVYDVDMGGFPAAYADSGFTMYKWIFNLTGDIPLDNGYGKDDSFKPLSDDAEILEPTATGISVVGLFPELASVTDNAGNTNPDAIKINVIKGTITTMPVFGVSVSERGNTAIMSYRTRLDNLVGKQIKDITLIKVKKDLSNREFRKVRNPEEVTDRAFSVARSMQPGIGLLDSEIIERDVTYTFYFGIKDNGEFDWDERPEIIVDPAAIAAKEARSGGGGGGGCSAAGFGFSALLLAAFILRSRKE